MKTVKTKIKKKKKWSPVVLKLPDLSTYEQNDILKNACVAYKHACNSVNSFYNIYQRVRKGSKGGTAHSEQDFLRAMLIFSCSGLDTILKQLIKDGLASVISNNKGACNEFQKFVSRGLRKKTLEEEKFLSIDTEFLSRALINESPRNLLIKELQELLIKDSLQSKDQLLRLAAHFAITKNDILENEDETRQAFSTRNEIIHEMDVDFSGYKNRRQRTLRSMKNCSKNILTIAANFVEQVNEKIQ
ncbi:MAG: hypothetical protein ABIJ60_02120 [Patescibacteria group bacterium]